MKTDKEKASYSRGYIAGKKRAQSGLISERENLSRHNKQHSNCLLSKEERAYYECLDIVTKNCKGWSIGGKKIDDAKGCCHLAKIFAKHSIKLY